MSAASELNFWLTYCERRGAISEDRGDTTLVVLPDALRREQGLPEDVVVTADPVVAREEGAVLLVRGHPALEVAATATLDGGDVGCWVVAPPQARLPDAAWLLAAARERFCVEHGRLDLDGSVSRAHLPILRVGALVTYTFADRFQERLEVCIDASTGLPLADDLGRRLVELPGEGSPTRSSPAALPHDPRRALAQAQAVLEERAAARLRQLAAEQDGGRRALLSETEAYYGAMLASLAERRGAVAPERQAAYDARAEATRAERARRLDEIAEISSGRHEIRPFRVHLILAPAVLIPVQVRRGERRWPLPLVWLLCDGEFIPPACPGCGALRPLVAGRHGLGCAACMPSAVPPSSTASVGPRPSQVGCISAPSPTAGLVGRPEVLSTPLTGSRPVDTVGSHRPVAVHRSGARSRPEPRPATPHLDQLRKLALEQQDRLVKEGSRLAAMVWEAAAAGAPLRGRHLVPGSPLQALYALWGGAGPHVLVGIRPGSRLRSIDTSTRPLLRSGAVTTGHLATDRTQHPFTLTWHLADGRAMASEVLPCLDDGMMLPMVPPRPSGGRASIGSLPRPGGEVDPVADALLESELEASGLPLVLRGIAAWWAVREAFDSGEPHPRITAAAAAYIVGRRAGRHESRAAVAARHGVRGPQVEVVVTLLRRALRDRPSAWW